MLKELANARKPEEYFSIYEKHFKPLRDEKLRILEIGVQTGQSLVMWRKFFQMSEVIGVDNDPDCARFDNVIIGDQTDEAFLKRLGSFDIVIDDGGHTMNQQQTSFKVLFPMLNKGGIYVIEDLHTSYWHGFNDSKKTTMEYLHELTHQLNSEATKESRSKIDRVENEYDIKSMHFYPSLCFIYK